MSSPVHRDHKVRVMTEFTMMGKIFTQRAIVLLAALSLSGCFDQGGDEKDGGPDLPPPVLPTQPAPPSNTPPEISGVPAAAVTAGQAYSFVPTARDADNDFLEFAITGKPTWAA